MRVIDIFAGLLAALGVTLGVEAWFAGSLLRYVLAGLVAGAALCLPLLTILVLRERGRRFWRRAMFAIVPLILVLLVAEGAIRMFGAPVVPPEILVADPVLGHAVQPGSGGTDEWGFRNARVPEQTDALFVGDSQTWGFFLDREESFPALFAKQTGLQSYQMANGGYGPVRYRELVRRGLALHPKLVVVGFYFGNDLWDAAAGAGLEGATDLRAEGRAYPAPTLAAQAYAKNPNWTMAFADFLQTKSRLCGWAGEVVKSRLRGSVSMLDNQAGAVPFTDGSVATILLPEYRRPALDLSKATLQDSVRITAECLTDIAEACQAAGARCVLLAIPTKEYCYAEWLQQRGTPMAELEGLRAAEDAVRSRIFAAATQSQIELLDLAPICIASLAAGTPIWAGNGDGHLMQNGHLAAANAIAEIWPGK